MRNFLKNSGDAVLGYTTDEQSNKLLITKTLVELSVKTLV